MKTFLKWGLRVLGGLLGIAVLGAVGLYFVSESIISKTHDVEGRALTVPDDAASIERGRKVALTRGCLGCHDRDGSGRVFIDSPMMGRVAAPNLTRLVRERSVAELDRGIRQGLREDGKSVVIMPSGMLHGLSDEDFTALIAYLRTLPLVDNELPSRRLGPMARFGLAIGQFETNDSSCRNFHGWHHRLVTLLPMGNTLRSRRVPSVTGRSWRDVRISACRILLSRLPIRRRISFG